MLLRYDPESDAWASLSGPPGDQTYELWFLQILHELDHLKVCLTRNELWRAIHVLKRVRMIVKTLVGQVDILETMTPMSFSSFRDRLDRAP